MIYYPSIPEQLINFIKRWVRGNPVKRAWKLRWIPEKAIRREL